MFSSVVLQPLAPHRTESMERRYGLLPSPRIAFSDVGRNLALRYLVPLGWAYVLENVGIAFEIPHICYS